MTTTRPRRSNTAAPAAAASPWAPSSVREQQREAKRNAVLSTAAQLFNEKGFHATSLDDIAARLHVTKPTLYYYVKNKEEILIECVRRGLEMMHSGIEASRQAGDQAVEQLMACMRTYTRIVTMDFGMCVIRIADDELPPQSRKALRRLKSGIDLEFRRLVAAGVEEGAIAPCDPKMTAFLIAGALGWIGRWYQPGGELGPEEIADQFIATLCQGILQSPAVPAAPARKRPAAPRPRLAGKRPARKQP